MMTLKLDDHDCTIVSAVKAAMDKAFADAHAPTAVAKRISVLATARRNKGRNAAIRKYPFRGICEASGKPLDKEHAELDEIESELGYAGKLRWLCQRANNSGKHSIPLGPQSLRNSSHEFGKDMATLTPEERQPSISHPSSFKTLRPGWCLSLELGAWRDRSKDLNE
jgi:hypothetical protein